MGLGLHSAIHTSSTGMKASEKTINVAGNNLANANTIGYKSERADFADFLSYTYYLGTSPGMGYSAGTNPIQIGMGVSIAGITTDFSQGSFKEGMTNSDIAINGLGFLITQNVGSSLNYYTRNGALKVNPDLFLTTNTGLYVMGYGINDKFQIQTNMPLTTLRIPIGEMHIAEQTNMVKMEGILSAVGDSATQGTVLQTPPMTDLSQSAPVETNPASITQLARPPLNNAEANGGNVAGGTMTDGDYLYRFVYVDANGVESDYSAPITATVQSGENSVTLDNLPSIEAGYTTLRIYRAVDTGDPTQTPEFYHVTDLTTGTTYTDTGTIDTTRTLDQSRLGESHQYSYQYYITYVDAFGNESRPVRMGDPQNINNGQVVLTNMPTADPQDGWTGRKIYRSSGSDP
ncbi:MAG: flagellar hook-basal body complex protein, partial [Planctomycetaceae bacterium]|nr:flagellar hook-basal body complex protein [Planctomycetaceae bacterium]